MSTVERRRDQQFREVALSGYAEAGSTVKVFNGSATLGSITARADGSWSDTYNAPQDGTYDFTVTATDSQGNTSAPGDDTSVEVDTVAPTSTVAALPATEGGLHRLLVGSDDPNGTGVSYDVATWTTAVPTPSGYTDTPLTSATYRRRRRPDLRLLLDRHRRCRQRPAHPHGRR